MLINLLFVAIGIIGLVTTILLLTNYRSNNLVNIYIVILLVIISARFLLAGLTYFLFDVALRESYTRYSNVSLIVIPVCYLYFKNLSTNRKKIAYSDLLHFIFPLFFIVFISNFSKNYFEADRASFAQYVLFFLFSFLYLFFSFLTINTKIWHRNNGMKIIQNHHTLIKNWTVFLFTALTLNIVRVLISICCEIYFDITTKGYSFQWISALIWGVILFKILLSPEILYGFSMMQHKIDEDSSNSLVLSKIWKTSVTIEVKNSNHILLKQKIDPLIPTYLAKIEEKSLLFELFRNPDITLHDLSHNLQIPKSHMSYVFKYHSTISFSEFKKVIRIYDAISLIEENYLRNNTLDSLSKKVGFTSYNPFFTSFKDITGVAPLEFCKQNQPA
jgi:AraC-like DNA-binding protein